LVFLVSDIVEVLPIVSSRFVVTVNGGVVILLVSLVSDIVEVYYSTISDTSESKSITKSPFTVTTNRDDTIGNTSTISDTTESKSITTSLFTVTTKLYHHDL
jgi:hypothetical protein